MRLGLVYSTLALIILVAALIAVKPMLKTPTEANLVNPTTAQQVIRKLITKEVPLDEYEYAYYWGHDDIKSVIQIRSL